MRSFAISTLPFSSFPPLLREIPDPPHKLYIRGDLPNPDKYKFLSIVGSRDYSSYGETVVKSLVEGLKGYPVCIISGLAIGIDTFAHEAALKERLKTIAVPGGGLDDRVLYPKRNIELAHNILRNDGALLSEYEPDFKAERWSFPKRNRIMAGLSHAVLVIEAREKSGTLITARLALEYNREVLVVPGNISSLQSKGANTLLKEGASLVESSRDILEILKLSI